MSSQNDVLPKFKPERAILLNTENTGFKTKDEVIFAVERLRARHWLCRYEEKVRPLHMSFNDERQLAEFKKDCRDLEVKLKSPVIKQDDFEQLLADDAKGQIVEGAEATNTYQDPSGQVHIEE